MSWVLYQTKYLPTYLQWSYQKNYLISRQFNTNVAFFQGSILKTFNMVVLETKQVSQIWPSAFVFSLFARILTKWSYKVQWNASHGAEYWFVTLPLVFIKASGHQNLLLLIFYLESKLICQRCEKINLNWFTLS